MKDISSLKFSHYPVMLDEIIDLCSPDKGGNFIDCTFELEVYQCIIFFGLKVISLDRDSHVNNYVLKLKKI